VRHISRVPIDAAGQAAGREAVGGAAHVFASHAATFYTRKGTIKEPEVGGRTATDSKQQAASSQQQAASSKQQQTTNLPTHPPAPATTKSTRKQTTHPQTGAPIEAWRARRYYE
jgi:hypothetical protein